MILAVKDIKKGDEFHDGSKHVWTALTDAEVVLPSRSLEPLGGRDWVAILVRFELDGGSDYRKWDDPTIRLNITRPGRDNIPGDTQPNKE